MDQEPTPPQEPRSTGGVRAKLAGALIGAVAALSIGGVGLAFAQEAETPTTETPTTEAPATEAPAAPADEDCPDKAGRAGGAGGGAEAPSTSTDAEV